jgi:hypothetical protein
MAMGWLITDNEFSDTDEVLADLWWVIGDPVCLVLIIVRVSRLRVQPSRRVGWLSLLLIVPLGIALLGVGLLFATESGVDWGRFSSAANTPSGATKSRGFELPLPASGPLTLRSNSQ